MEFDETLRFWYPHVALDSWTDFAFCSNKIYGPNSIDFREKFFSLYPSLLSFFLAPSFICPSPPFDFYLLFFFSMCPSLIRVCFYPETIYLFLVQFILNELSSSHFLTSEIFVKISSLESLATYHSETRKNFLLSQNSTKFF